MAKSHSRLAPSSSHRWLVCSGEPNMREAVPQPEDTEFSKEGTTAHWLAEKAIVIGIEPHEFIGAKCPDTGMEVTEEMADAVKVYTDEVAKHKGFSKTETKFSLSDVHPDLAGTSDYCVYVREEKTLYVYDYKHGKGVFVEVEDNPQLKIYGLGAARTIASLIGEAEHKLIDYVVLGVVQPRNHDGDSVIRYFKITLADLHYWRDHTLKPATIAADDPAAPLRAGNHCRFCPALGSCAAAKQFASEVARVDFERIILPQPAMLSPADKARVLDSEPLLTAWFKAVGEHVLADLQKGLVVPGYKLVQKRANRQWVNEEEAEVKLIAAIGDKAYTKKILSPAQAEKALGKKNAALVSALTFKPDNGLTLAAEDDRREEVSPLDAASDFKDFALPQK